MTTTTYGGQSNVGKLLSVAMRRPEPSTVEADPAKWHYAHRLNAARVAAAYRQLVSHIENNGTKIHWIEDPGDGLADAVFTYDPSFMTDHGAIILSMGKDARRREPSLHAALYTKLGIPILDYIEPPGTVDGGDCFWLDDSTLAVGCGYRSNNVGVEQLTSTLAPLGVEVCVYPLPAGRDPAACLHLMSLVSPLAADLALVHEGLLPDQLGKDLRTRDIKMLAVDESEFDASKGLNLNVLALSPRTVVAIDGFPNTLRALQAEGCTVATFDGAALSIPAEGGPTCMTRPIHRATA